MDASNATTDEEKQATKITCDVLCSLSSAGADVTPPPATSSSSLSVGGVNAASHSMLPPSAASVASSSSPPVTADGNHGFFYTPSNNQPNDDSDSDASGSQQQRLKNCPKQHQLPLFLSKTYHMIDRCDPEIATWSSTGDNFIVKNVDNFASSVLPLYFKHSNFSSFARQLNFYGFRKLRSDPILTNDVDPQTANYVRFYHEHFQKDRPDLLHQIKRATKSEQHAKDDVDSLKSEVYRLKECVQSMSSKMERQLAEMSYEYNRRIANLSTEYDKLTNLVTQLLQHHRHQNEHAAYLHHQHHLVGGGPPSIVEASYLSNSVAAQAAPSAATTSSPASAGAEISNHLPSLAQIVAMRLQQQQQQQQAAIDPPSTGTTAANTLVQSDNGTANVGCKRSTPPKTGSRQVESSSNKKLHL
ncbi:HSF-type DNA-binding protein [Nitzschia inconspicua]|uniref:HSF-type DNA-binding protein n=1 Tax=Nitzschia inconspicua TaxID=303405 RepID=A0A9K3M6I6_9STRA|nr:HSF-type DNA-binding protein [Nitzschia inconspicua]